MRALPSPLSRFIGRHLELDQLTALVGEHRLVTLVGPGGCGKTRLLLEHLARRPSAPVVAVDLGPVTEATGVVAAMLEAAGAPAQAPGDPLAQLAAHLPPDAVVVLDTCEHVVDAAAELLAGLLGSRADLTGLATSREPLGVPGEVVFRVASLTEADAVALFADRAQLVQPGFDVGDDLPAVVEVCHRLDGLPLAIELAAARLSVHGVRQIAAGLDDRFRTLTGDRRVAVARSRTLEASVAWSFDLLDDHEQAALIGLSVFRAAFPFSAGVAVVESAADLPAAADAASVVEGLVRRSLVQAEPTDPEATLRNLDTIAAFAGEVGVTRAPEVLARARDLHLAWYVAAATAAGQALDQPRPDRALGRLRAWHPDLLAALAHAHHLAADDHGGDPGATDDLWRLCGALPFAWAWTGRFAEAHTWFHRAAACAASQPALELPARWGAAHVALYGGDLTAAVDALASAAPIAEAIGDQRHLGRIASTQATIDLFADADRAEAGYERAVLHAGQAGDDWCVADALQASAYGDLFTLRLDRTAAKLDRARPLAEHLDHPLLLAWDRAGQGLLAAHRGDHRGAIAHLDEADEQLRRLPDPNIVLYVALGRAMAGTLTDGPEPHRRRLAAAVADAELVGAGVALPVAIPTLVRLHVTAGDADAARRLLDAWAPLLLGLIPRSAWQLHLLAAQVATADGRPDQARQELDAARATSATHVTPAQRATVLAVGGAVLLDGGSAEEAEADLVAALRPLLAAGLLPELADALDALAAARAARGAPDGARFAGAAARLRADLGIVAGAAAAAGGAGAATSHRTTGDAAAWEAGHESSLADVVAAAGRGRGRRGRPSIGWGALTPTERQVADLAAEGLTNAEIGRRLLMGTETVKTHLARAYDKVGVRNRAALATARPRSTDPPSGHPPD